MPKVFSRKPKDEAPEPLRRCVNKIKPVPDAEELWLFDQQESDGVTHRMEMLAKDMSRLSGSLGGLRSLLSDVAATAPLIVPDDALPANALLLADEMLFEGESKVEAPMAIAPADGADFLFEDAPVPQTPAASFDARVQLPMPEDRRAA